MNFYGSVKINLKEASTGLNKYVNAYMDLSYSMFDGMGDWSNWSDFADTLASDYDIKFNNHQEPEKIVAKGMGIMYERNPERFKEYVESLIIDSCVNDGYFDYLDSKSHKEKSIIKNLQILLEYLQSNGGSQEAIEAITNELGELSNVQTNARQVGEEFCRYMEDHSFWKVMGTNCRYWTNKDSIKLPNGYACLTGSWFNFLLYDRKWTEDNKTENEEGLGYCFKNSNNGVIADLFTYKHPYIDYQQVGNSFEITPENKDSVFAKMKRAYVMTANQLKKKHLVSYEKFLKSWRNDDTEENREEYRKNLRQMGMKESSDYWNDKFGQEALDEYKNNQDKNGIPKGTKPFKVGDPVYYSYLSDNNEHNGVVGNIEWLRKYQYYPFGHKGDSDTVIYKWQGSIKYPDGSTEPISDVYAKGGGVTSPLRIAPNEFKPGDKIPWNYKLGESSNKKGNTKGVPMELYNNLKKSLKEDAIDRARADTAMGGVAYDDYQVNFRQNNEDTPEEFIINKTPYGFTEVIYKGYTISNMYNGITVDIGGDEASFNSVEEAIQEIDKLDSDPNYRYSDYSVDDEYGRLVRERNDVASTSKDDFPVSKTNDIEEVKKALTESETKTKDQIEFFDTNTVLDELGSDAELITAMYDKLGYDTNNEFIWDTVIEDMDNEHLYIKNGNFVLNKDGKTVICSGRANDNMPIVYTESEGNGSMGLLQKVLDKAEELGWSYSETNFSNNEVGYEFENYSPAGEDYIVDACCGAKDLPDDEKAKNLVEEIRVNAMNFDADEHIDMWIEARGNGVSGVPSTRELVEDADEIQKMLDKFSDGVDSVIRGANSTSLDESEKKKNFWTYLD